MKTLLFLITIFESFVFAQQEYTLFTHPMYSKIWVKEYEITKLDDGSYHTTSLVKPKSGGKFKILTGNQTDSIRSEIDFDFVRENLIYYLNDFRSDYGVSPVTENQDLMSNSNDYAYELMQINRLVHSERSSERFEEAIVFIPFTLFSKVSDSDGKLEEIVAESCFDIFIGSPGHISILLKEDPLRSFGVGISVSHTGFYVVVQSIVE